MPKPPHSRPTHLDFRDLVTRDELVRAMILLSEDRDRAEAAAAEMFSNRTESFGMAGDLVSALSSLSPELAERVRLLLGETEAAAAARLADFRARTPSARSE